MHGRPLTLEEMVAKVDAVGIDDLAALAAGMLQSPPTLAAIGPVRKLPDVADIVAGAAARQSAVGL